MLLSLTSNPSNSFMRKLLMRNNYYDVDTQMKTDKKEYNTSDTTKLEVIEKCFKSSFFKLSILNFEVSKYNMESFCCFYLIISFMLQYSLYKIIKSLISIIKYTTYFFICVFCELDSPAYLIHQHLQN